MTFSDVNTGGAAKTIGTIHGGGKGRLRFTPAPGRGRGRGRGRIIAQFTLAGIPAERLTVAHYNHPRRNCAPRPICESFATRPSC